MNKCYPPPIRKCPISPDGVEAQLQSIKAIIGPTIATYQKTNELSDIENNLDIIGHTVRYLKGQIQPCNPPEEPDNPDTPPELYHPKVRTGDTNAIIGITNVITGIDPDPKKVSITITGNELEPIIENPELFGPISNNDALMSVIVTIPIEIGQMVRIRQDNNALRYFGCGPDIYYDYNRERYIKEKTYMYEGTDLVEDPFEYEFVIEPKRQYVQIDVTDIATDEIIITYYIYSNILFKEEPEEIPPTEPQPTPPPEPGGSEEKPPEEETVEVDTHSLEQEIDKLRIELNAN